MEVSLYYKLKCIKTGQKVKLKPQIRVENRGRAITVDETYLICFKQNKHLHYFTCGEQVFHLEKMDRFEHCYIREVENRVKVTFNATIERLRCGDLSVSIGISTKKIPPPAKKRRLENANEMSEADVEDNDRDDIVVEVHDVDGDIDGPSLCELYNIELW